MSSLNKTSSQGKAGPAGPSSQAILLEKLNRRSTPDSEALASSDDEAEGHRHEVPPLPMHQKPVRRASWLNDTSQAAARPRKGSFASSSMSPTASHPSTPAADAGTGAWGTHPAPGNILGRGHAGPSSFPWGTGIWNNDRKEPPSRLAEVLPSPTSTHPPGSSGSSFFGPEAHPGQTSPAPREQGPNSQIPFAIPLHPTPKTYRSQSYSVGQLDPDVVGPAMGSATALNSRSGRTIPHSGLQHRPSRPSMLSEMSNDGGMLGKVKEVEDDDEEDAADPLHGLQSQSAEAKAIEMLTRENALLRQQASQQYHNARIRPRASTAATYGLGNGYGLQESVPEESDFAIDELEEAQEGGDLSGKRAAYRRMSEFGGAGSMRSPFTLENRKLENVKKAFWQSSLGFGGVGDISQSRRHSFADVPTRHGSIGSIADTVISHEAVSQEAQHAQDFASPFSDAHNFPSNAPASYFTGGPGIANAHNNYLPAAYSNPYQAPYSMQAPFSNRSSSPHRSMYGMSQPNRSTPLHVVLFKCARADVFYIQEGTGLTVKPGDLVIVEADRGTDLGTVAADNVDWVEAKRLKEHYAEEQYKWLMMYSQTAGVAQDGAGAGLMAATNGLQGSAVGGMGPPGQHHMQEPNSGELKPKLIKRLAQNHEVQALRDKEGNEAKAKRVCMQKVKEHGLNMEILDAEFQMDWKKLTFYYFADSYINFNSLVTDLFKIYKTRIWMSAINPASFASQPLGLQAPSGIGPGAVGVGRGPHGSERRPAPQQEQQQAAFGSTGAGATPRPFAMSFNASFGAERPSAGGSGYVPSGYPYTPYGAFGATNRPANNSYGSPVEPFASGYPQGADYPGSRGRFSSPQSATSPHDQSVSPLAGPGDWVGSFQGLSLNSR